MVPPPDPWDAFVGAAPVSDEGSGDLPNPRHRPAWRSGRRSGRLATRLECAPRSLAKLPGLPCRAWR